MPGRTRQQTRATSTNNMVDGNMDDLMTQLAKQREPGVMGPQDYKHPHAVLEETVMTQHSMKKGIKLFGDAGVDAVLMELQQLHD